MCWRAPRGARAEKAAAVSDGLATSLKEAVEEAVREACLAELEALKPGNIHVHAATRQPRAAALLADFRHSAAVAAPALVAGGPGVGRRVLRAVEATRAAVGHNTNLGILLLAAVPVEAVLVETGPAAGDLRARVAAVLRRLDREDAAHAFRAIALASPAGLGRAAAHDVQEPPTVDLRTAMAAAADRDLIARQYVTDFAAVFEIGVAALDATADLPPPWATTAAYLAFLAAAPDSHIVRKHGQETAEAVRRRAGALHARTCAAGGDPRAVLDRLQAFDRLLHRARVNPGTSADLTVAALLVRRLAESRNFPTDLAGPPAALRP